MDYLRDKSVQKFLLVAVVVVVAIWLYKSRSESFVSEVRESEQEIPIKPPYINNDVRTLMSGSGFIPQKEVIGPWDSGMEVPHTQFGIADGLDDGEGGSLGLNYNLCSPACCSEQWPTPFKLPYDNFICKSKDQFTSNNYLCNNSFQNSGCVCMTKRQAEFIGDRGNNAY